MASEDRAHQEELLRAYRRRLQVLQLQAAQFGIYAPPHITIEIEELEAKIAEVERGLGPAARSVPTAPEGKQLPQEQIRQLTDLLVALPSMSNRSARDAVLQQLPGRITNAISRNDIARVDVYNIALTALNYERGLEQLVAAARFFDDGTRQMEALDAFVSRLGAA